jgi:adenylate cyclase class IV
MLRANIESKTRCEDLRAVARLAAALGARCEGWLEQVDTYFRVRNGRLKLREIAHHAPDGRASASSELIRYERPDETGARVSTYERTDVEDAESARRRLASAHGLRGCIRKRRELWLVDSTRIHLDRVDGLGDFVELETVCAGEPSAADALEHRRLWSALCLDRYETVDCSYIDLLTTDAGGRTDESGR